MSINAEVRARSYRVRGKKENRLKEENEERNAKKEELRKKRKKEK